jgi:hypothetical protein
VTEFKVNFLVAGAQKGGTTALARFLAADPRICMAPEKEVHFFDAPGYDETESTASQNSRYRTAFPNYHGQEIVGEATPIYMYVPCIAQRIHRYNPDMKLILLLRDPVGRAISQYRMNKERDFESLSLFWAIAAEPFRLWRHRNYLGEDSHLRFHSYLDRGFYGRQIHNLLRYFPTKQILALRSEDLWQQHFQVLDRIYKFLGLTTPVNYPAREKIYASTAPLDISWALRRFLAWRYRTELSTLDQLISDMENPKTSTDTTDPRTQSTKAGTCIFL